MRRLCLVTYLIYLLALLKSLSLVSLIGFAVENSYSRSGVTSSISIIYPITIIKHSYHSFVTDLGSEVVLEGAHVFDPVLNNERLFLVHLKESLLREDRCLVEHVEVPESKLEFNLLLAFDDGDLVLLVGIISGQLNVTRSNLTFDFEGDFIVFGANSD